MVVLWVDGYGMGRLTAEPLKTALLESKILAFDGDQALRRDSGETPATLYLPDRHFSTLGNTIAARQTAKWLVGLGLLAPGQ